MVLKAIKIQTDNLIRSRKEETKAKEREAETQTCAEFKSPIPVRFVPKHSGNDAQTQIEDCDLFDFDTEVQPMVEVLVERSLTAAVLELKEERELARIRERQESFHKVRRAELVEVQRLEASEKRKQEEKIRRMDQERAKIEVAKRVMSKAVSIKISRELFSGICQDAVNSLRDKDFFRDPTLVYLETVYVPNLITKALEARADEKNKIDRLISNSIRSVTV